jgi:hypothetical protein
MSTRSKRSAAASVVETPSKVAKLLSNANGTATPAKKGKGKE